MTPPDPPHPTSAPLMCRLCRRTIPRAAAKCPHCGARQLWSLDRDDPKERTVSTAKIVAYAVVIVVLVVVAFSWRWVQRAANVPISTVESAGKPAKLGPPIDCATLAAELATPSGSSAPLTVEVRERFRECLGRR